MADADELRSRHAAAYLRLGEEAAQHFTHSKGRWWLDRIAEDHDNLRAAHNWAIARGDAEMAQRLCGALWRFWQMRGHVSEGRKRSEASLALGEGTNLSRLRALEGAGGLAYWQIDGAATIAFYEEQVEVARRLGDRRELGFALYNLASGQAVVGEEVDLATIGEAIAVGHEIDDALLLGSAYWGLGSYHYLGTGPSRPDRAEHVAEAIAALTKAAFYLAGTDASFEIGWTDNMLGISLLVDGRPDEAIAHLRAGFRRFVDAGDLSALPLQVAAFADFALIKGNPELGLLLAGATETLQGKSQTRLLDLPINELRHRADAVAAIGSERAESLRQEGAALSVEQVLKIVSEL
jgi:hypothetical protein